MVNEFGVVRRECSFGDIFVDICWSFICGDWRVFKFYFVVVDVFYFVGEFVCDEVEVFF